MIALPGWIFDVVACPQEGCGGRLAAAPLRAGSGTVSCRRCDAMYPVLAGVPVLVPTPAHWMAAYRDAVLASLAEEGAAGRDAVAVVQAFADAAPEAEPQRFGDDWIGAPAESPPGEVGRVLAPLLTAAGPEVVLDGFLDGPLGVVADLGCGDGALAARLARRTRSLLLGDVSLRAVLRGRRRVRGRSAAAVVLDVEHLPLARGRFDAIAAANVIDLLDDPMAFVAGAARALRRGGRFALSTPQPGLGASDDDPEVVRGALIAAGLRIRDERDDVPWLRHHRARYQQVYTCWAAVARR